MPRNCSECYELFKVGTGGEITLCTGKKLFKPHNALYRSLHYYFFIRLGILEPEYKSSCYHFPRTNGAFVELMQKYNRCSHYLDLAEESLGMGKADKGLAYIRKARRLGYGRERVYMLMGFYFEQKEKFEEAIQELSLAEKIYPHHQKIKDSLAHCRSRNDR